jgi:hypothetical protein
VIFILNSFQLLHCTKFQGEVEAINTLVDGMAAVRQLTGKLNKRFLFLHQLHGFFYM